MDRQRIIMIVALGAFILYGVYAVIYCATSHFKCENKALLRRDARIRDIKTGRIGNRASRQYRTVVFFDDQSEFISHKTNREYGIMTRTISVDAKLRTEILQDAVAAHQKALEAYEKKHKRA